MTKHPTPAQMVQQHLQASARTARLARSIIETELKILQEELKKPNLPPTRRGECIRVCAELLQLLDKSVEQSARLLIRPAQAGAGHDASGEPTPDVDDILLEMTEGRKPRR